MWPCENQTIHTKQSNLQADFRIGNKCSLAEAELKGSGPAAGHGQAEGTAAEVITDSESSAGL